MPNEPLGPIQQLLDSIESAWPVHRWADFNVLVAVSGGRDSVALLRALHATATAARQSSDLSQNGSGRLIVAHYNHGVRGLDSAADQVFVQRLSEELGLQCEVKIADKSEALTSNENHFREHRYAFLRQVAGRTESRYIATAHHAGDQAETILFRMLRGTGIAGLAGIAPTRRVNNSLSLVRPMLAIDPTTIDAAIQQWNQDFRVDGSNASSDFSRNFLRNEILPQLRRRFGVQIDANLCRLGRQASDHQDFVLESVAPLIDDAASIRGDHIFVDRRQFGGVSALVAREFFAELFRRANWPMGGLSLRDFDRLAEIASSGDDVPKFQLPGNVSCSVAHDRLKLERG